MEWGGKTVIEQVTDVLSIAGINEIVVVAGELVGEIGKVLAGKNINVVFNHKYANGEMTDSLKIGLNSVSKEMDAALVTLGDQPFIKPETVKAIIHAYQATEKAILMPSINNKRGHPWIIRKDMWPEILSIETPQTMRDLFHSKEDQIGYVLVDDPGVIEDMDTPEDYQKQCPDPV
jgi:molybdenum cofactor cytidylyltransferase